jgi:thiol-disulfide isomerase/thioredoxin
MSALLYRCWLVLPLLLFMSLARAHVMAGDTPPDFLGETRGGDAIHLSAMRGKVVVVTFWASWCPTCMKEFPNLTGIQKLVSPAQLQVVAINQDDHATFRKLSRYLEEKAPNLVLAFDPGPIAKAYGANAIPETLLIDRDGKVAYIHIGYSDDMLDDIASEISRLLAKPPQPGTPART